MRWPGSVTLCEVGPRDGFQMEATFIPTDVKVRVINSLSRTGLPEIQATAFVHPKAIPQLRDAEEVMARIERRPGVRYTGLVLNERGAERAVAAAADRIDIVVSASDSHSLSNANMTTAQAMERAGRVAALARQAGVDVGIGFATALGCPFEGFLSHARIEGLVARAVQEFGVSRVGIADTAGMANPALVGSMMRALRERFPGTRFSLHLHNTRGMGLANIVAGLDAGITHYDAAVAGLGGCPYAPGATGNVATEDVVHMLEEMGIATYVRLDALLAAAAEVQEVVGHADSAVLRAGTSRMLLGHRREGQTKLDSGPAAQ
jgi:hydroxymethylglutaryl-CoA lyase